MSGYIYVRKNKYWDLDNVYKLGKTLNIPNRNNNYITSELVKGKFIMVLEMNDNIIDVVESKLKKYFEKINLHVIYDAGTEFYKRDIINKIIPYLNTYDLKYKILSNDEIENLLRINYYKPRLDQEIIIKNSIEYFKNENKGILVLMCGIGKTLISLWIIQKLNLNKILIGVPNILLLFQWKDKVNKLFKNHNILIVYNDIKINNIIKFLNNNDKFIIISTYSSSYKILSATNELNYEFDIKVLDEVHHLTANNYNENNKQYIDILKIKSNKQLSLTATLKLIDNDNEDIISNDNEKYFGKIIDKKNLLWAIENNIICDYLLQTIITDTKDIDYNKFNINDELDIKLFLSAYSALKSINDNNSHHILIYSNSTNNSLKIIKYIELLFEYKYFIINDIYYSDYNSSISNNERNNILNNFTNYKYGILTCVYCLGEGYDLPLLDGVIFSENMTSNIRIVQSALRANRKNINEPNKISKIILPILNNDKWLDNDNEDFKKIREVIYQLSTIDDNIIHKIKVYNIKCIKNNMMIENKININNLGEYDIELTKILKLKTMNRQLLNITYNKAKNIIKNYNIKNKNDYYNICDFDNRLSKEPEIIYKNEFTNWIDYLNIERKYYDFETCKKKINEYLNKNKLVLDINTLCKKLCEIDDNYPPLDLWLDYYDIEDFTKLINNNITIKKKLILI
jgi:superfamily II DNA or RNA helicase